MLRPVTDLRQWLQHNGLAKYAAVLAENEVDLDVLPGLEEGDFEKIGIPLGARKKLLKPIRGLTDNGAASLGDARVIPAPASGREERRRLTVMFADLAGSTRCPSGSTLRRCVTSTAHTTTRPRAATDYVRLLGSHGERDRTRELLAPVYRSFTEGFETADLQDAKAALDG